jgi:hypothetical protein
MCDLWGIQRKVPKMSYYDNAVMMSYGLGVWDDARRKRGKHRLRGDTHRGRSAGQRQPLHWF